MRFHLPRSHAFQAQERFVDAVDLHGRRVLAEDLHDPPAHVAIQRIVAAEHLHGVLLEVLPPLEGRRAHRDAQRLRLRGYGL